MATSTTTTPKSGTPRKPAEAKEPPKEADFRIGSFAFTFASGTTMPAPTTPTANPLPFASMFDKMQVGQQAFLPDRFWYSPASEGGRGSERERVEKPGYVRGKLRDAFKAWRSRDEEHRARLEFFVTQRLEGDQADAALGLGPTFPEPGHSFWITEKK